MAQPVEFLIGTPDTLPQDLLADRNLQKQGVSKKGLGAQQACKFARQVVCWLCWSWPQSHAQKFEADYRILVAKI